MKKTISLIALLALACSMLVGCNFGGGKPEQESNCEFVYPSLYGFFEYRPKETSYAKVEVIDFKDDVYTKEQELPEGTVMQDRIMIAKCKIQEDYYETLDAGTEITVHIPVRFHRCQETKFDEIVSEISDLFTNSESLLIYLPPVPLLPPFNYYLNGEKVDVEDEARIVTIEHHKIIPIEDGKLQVARIDGYYDKFGLEINKTIEGYFPRFKSEYEDYFRDGMPEDELRENLKRLRQLSI